MRAALTAQGRDWNPERLRFRSYSIEELEDYLDDDRDNHAVVLKSGPVVAAVWCGIHQTPDNFHWMLAPFEAPNEVFGGSLTARRALQEAFEAVASENW